MFNEKPIVKVYRVTVKKVIQRLLEIQDCPLDQFKDLVVEKFDGYDYEGEEELTGFEQWGKLNLTNTHQLPIKIAHEDAYEFTLFCDQKEGKITVTNVL